MKLIKPAVAVTEKVAAGRHVGFVDTLVTSLMGTGVVPTLVTAFDGQTVWTNPIVDFGPHFNLLDLSAGTKNVVFGNKLYRGLSPRTQVGPTQYECQVGQVETIEIGEL